MSTTVVGLFDNFDDAQRAVNDLEAAGFSHADVSIVSNNADQRFGAHDTGHASGGHGRGLVAGAAEGAVIGGLTGLAASLALLLIPGVGPVAAAGPLAATLTGATLSGAGLGAVGGGIIGGLAGAGVPKEEAGLYAEGVRRGGTLVTVRADDARADEAGRILDRHNPVDIDQRGGYYRSTGFNGYQENAPAYTADQIHADRAAYSTFATSANVAPAAPALTTGTTVNRTETVASTNVAPATNRTLHSGEREVIPVVEEQLAVGKREVERGGARIRSYVTERPVEEQVTLREEHVNVERHAVNRPVSDADAAFREQTIEVRERAEEAVVAKQARVVEEVVVNKEATQHTETIRDTVRRTDVDVDELNTGDTTVTGGVMSFDRYNDDFRNDFSTRYASSGGTYNEYQPAYRFGYDLSNDARYRDASDWSTLEPQVRRDWEARGLGTWDRFKDSVRYGWERTKMAGRHAGNAVTR